MNTRLALILSLALLPACLPESEPVGESESSGSESQTGGETSEPTTAATMSTSGASMTGASTVTTDSSTVTSSTVTSESTVTSAETGTASSSEGTGESGETTTSSDTEGQACQLEPIVCEFIENGKVLPEDVVDCGRVTLDDDAMAWQAAQTCVLNAFDVQAAYKVFAELQGIDSNVERALGGFVGFAYQPVEYLSDSGGLGPDFIRMRNCAPVVPPDCTPMPGELCLFCSENDDYQTVCMDP